MHRHSSIQHAYKHLQQIKGGKKERKNEKNTLKTHRNHKIVAEDGNVEV